MKTKLSGRFWAALTIFSLMGQVAWVVENMYFNVFIYNIFHASAADISHMVAASSVAATLTTVLMGALSDRLGKRKVFISAGYVLWGISILSFTLLRTDVIGALFPMAASTAAVGVSLVIIMDCVMTFFGSSANDAAFNAWLTDSTDSTNRGAAEGINSMMPLVAILVVFGGFMFFDLTKIQSWTVIFTVIGGLTLVFGILGLFLIKEPNIKPVKDPYFKTVFYGFKPATVKQNPTLYVTLLAYIVFNISIQIFMPYLILYYTEGLKMANYVLIMAPAIILAAVFTAFWGKAYDKKGFRFAGLCSVGLLMVGYLLLYFFRTTPLVFAGSLLMMAGYLSGMAVFGAAVRDHTPAGKAGMLQGVRIFAQVFVPGIVGPFIGKLILANAQTVVNSDGTTSFIPNQNIFLGALVAIVVILPFFGWIRRTVKPRTVALYTPFEEQLPEQPFAAYPRPQMKRDSYLCLNGRWNFAVQTKKERLEFDGITVPYPPESRLSGVERITEKGDLLLYSRTFTLPKGFQKDRVLLHFGAVDQEACVYVNDRQAGWHTGGYLPFTFDITPLLQEGTNTLRVEVTDPLDQDLPYGKQRTRRGGMWYTKISGIWQTVWLESVPQDPILNLKITPTLTDVTVEVEGGAPEKTLLLGEKSYKFTDRITIPVENPHLWTPDDPYLYEFAVVSGQDRVESYFGLRTVGLTQVKGKTLLCLNGKPTFFHGLLDQGYFSDGIYLPATEEGYENDILQMKACGFNMLRKHIKLEPDLFYYYCDKYGMVVFQDFINSGRYSFLVDTAIPTVWLRKGITHRATEKRKTQFYLHGQGIQQALYNHPSVVYYTIFNEGWGQFDAQECYAWFKEQDPTRIYDTTSGWFKEMLTDVESDHIYFKPVKLTPVPGNAMVLSEFGGYSCKVKDHSFNLDQNTGYHFFTQDPKELEKALCDLYRREILANIDNGLCATVYTQLSDVEDETNGLFTYDRQVLKVQPENMAALAQELYDRFEQTHS